MESHRDLRFSILLGHRQPDRPATWTIHGQLRGEAAPRGVIGSVRAQLRLAAPDDRAVALLRPEHPSVLRVLRDEHAAGGEARRAVVPQVEGPRYGLRDDGEQLRRPDGAGADRIFACGRNMGLGVRGHGASGLRGRPFGLPLRPRTHASTGSTPRSKRTTLPPPPPALRACP